MPNGASDADHAVGTKGQEESTAAESDARSTGKPVADKAAGTAHAAKDKLQSRAEDVASERKDAAAGRVSGLAEALEGAASSLEERGQGTEARFARQAADSLSRLAQATQGKEVEDIVGTIEDFGRRQPVAFLTGSVIAGFALSRFLKSSGGNANPGARRNGPSGGGSR